MHWSRRVSSKPTIKPLEKERWAKISSKTLFFSSETVHQKIEGERFKQTDTGRGRVGTRLK